MKWISIKTRLPGKNSGKTVLTCNSDGGIMMGWLVGWRGEYTCELDNKSMSKVTHWMLLPKPPKNG